MLNNTFQDLGDFVIYPKELFEIGTLTGRHFAIHLNAGVWRPEGSDGSNAKNKIKELISRNERVFDFVQILVRRKRYRILNKGIPFYEYSIAQKNGDALPEL